MVLTSALRSSLSSGEDRDYYNVRRKLLQMQHSEGPGESQTCSHLGWVLKDEQEFTRREQSRKGRSYVQRQRDTKEQGHDSGCAGIFHVRDGRGGLVGHEAEDVSLTLLSKEMDWFFLVWGAP